MLGARVISAQWVWEQHLVGEHRRDFAVCCTSQELGKKV